MQHNNEYNLLKKNSIHPIYTEQTLNKKGGHDSRSTYRPVPLTASYYPSSAYRFDPSFASYESGPAYRYAPASASYDSSSAYRPVPASALYESGPAYRPAPASYPYDSSSAYRPVPASASYDSSSAYRPAPVSVSYASGTSSALQATDTAASSYKTPSIGYSDNMSSGSEKNSNYKIDLDNYGPKASRGDIINSKFVAIPINA